MKLTAKQSAFCLAYMETGNASESYRRAYSAGNMKPETVTKRASELLANGEVAGRLIELREQVAGESLMTVTKHLEDLKGLRDAAKAEGKYSAAVAAEVARGKVSGFYVEKLEHSGEIRTPELKLVLHGTKPSPPTN